MLMRALAVCALLGAAMTHASAQAIPLKAQRFGPISSPSLALTGPGSTGDGSLFSVMRSDGVAQTLGALADGVKGKADKTDLGSGVGVNWAPFQHRILVLKDHVGDDTQQILDIQANTRPGALGTFEATSSAVSITSRSLPGTTYGMFNLVALMENFAERLPGGVDTGNTGANLYTRQHNVNAVSGWGYAAEAKETHGLPNPTNGTLAGENAIVATGTDANHKRGALFLPLNILPGNEATFTEAYHALYVKTAPNTRYFHGGLFEGDYVNVITANGVNARSFLVGTGNFTAPVIDLHAVSSAGNGAAIALNAAHSIQWQTALGVTLGGLAYDTSVPSAPTIQITGVRTQAAPGGGLEAVLSINGTRYGIALRALP